MLPRLLQVRTLGRTFQRDFALLAATLGTDAVVQRQAKALFFPYIADGTAQFKHLGEPRSGSRKLSYYGISVRLQVARTRMDVAFSSAPVEKTA